MSDLLTAVLNAHGGLDHWREFSRVEATIVSGGKLWDIKDQPQDPAPRRIAVTLHNEWASVRPFGAADQKTDFTPERIAIEKLDGRLVAERRNPRDSFASHQLMTPWDPLQRGYFNGYALWTYLTTPFLMALPGFSVQESTRSRTTARHGRGCKCVSRSKSPATAPCRSSTSARTTCYAATTTASMWPADFRPSNTSTTSSAPTGSKFHLTDARIAAIPTGGLCPMN